MGQIVYNKYGFTKGMRDSNDPEDVWQLSGPVVFPYLVYVAVPIRDANGEYILDYVLGQDMVTWHEQGEITARTQEHLYEGDTVIIAYRQMLKEQIEMVLWGGDPMNVLRHPAENVPWTPTLEGWPAATIEAATRRSRPWRQRTTSYRCNFHQVSKAGWKYIEDDVDRYCPDRELILKLYEEADRVMQQQALARQ